MFFSCIDLDILDKVEKLFVFPLISVSDTSSSISGKILFTAVFILSGSSEGFIAQKICIVVF